MKRLFLISLIFTALSLHANTYRLVQGNFTWLAAKTDAEAKGGHLVTITTFTEEQELKKLFPLLNSSIMISWAIGATTENGGSWITGELVTHMPWRSGYGPGRYSSEHKYAEWHEGGMRNMKNNHKFNGYILEIEETEEKKEKRALYTYLHPVPPGFSMMQIPFSYKDNNVSTIFNSSTVFGALSNIVLYDYDYHGGWLINSYDDEFEEWMIPNHVISAGTAVWILNNTTKIKYIQFKGHRPSMWREAPEETLIP
jgi:hypothetical protein